MKLVYHRQSFRGVLFSMDKKARRWPELPWDKVVERVQKAVFRLYAGNSAGTCFAISIGSVREGNSHYVAFATAWHVLEDLPGTPGCLRLVSADGTVTVSDTTASVSFCRLGPERFDTGLIFVQTPTSLLTQEDLLPTLPFGWQMARGTEIGWLGFPGLVEPELCFFKGVVSGYLNDPPTYLVDGVAVNGVSGGPAFDNRAHVIGLVSSYLPNTLGNMTLPGILTLMPIAAVRLYFEEVLRARVI